MTKINDILTFLEEFAPYNLAESWDNCGLMVGNKEDSVTNILCSLDITPSVIDESIKKNCNLIIAHHPLIFTSVKCVTASDSTGSMIIKSILNNISIICMHTNLDSTLNGVNDALANKLNLLNISSDESAPMGRIGNLSSEMDFSNFLDYVKKTLNANGLKYTGLNPCNKIAVLGGSGGKMIDFAIKNGCDTFITGDCSYDAFQKANYLGLNLIDAGHFATENAVIDVLVAKINKKFSNICTSSKEHHDIINFR